MDPSLVYFSLSFICFFSSSCQSYHCTYTIYKYQSFIWVHLTFFFDCFHGKKETNLEWFLCAGAEKENVHMIHTLESKRRDEFGHSAKESENIVYN